MLGAKGDRVMEKMEAFVAAEPAPKTLASLQSQQSNNQSSDPSTNEVSFERLSPSRLALLSDKTDACQAHELTSSHTLLVVSA